jgi:hypothetical protein
MVGTQTLFVLLLPLSLPLLLSESVRGQCAGASI